MGSRVMFGSMALGVMAAWEVAAEEDGRRSSNAISGDVGGRLGFQKGDAVEISLVEDNNAQGIVDVVGVDDNGSVVGNIGVKLGVDAICQGHGAGWVFGVGMFGSRGMEDIDAG